MRIVTKVFFCIFISQWIIPAELFAGGKLALNQVWSRLADIHGELGSIESSEFSPDSRRVVSGSKFDYTVRMFRTSDGHQLWVTELPAEIERVAWTQDGNYVVSVSEDFMMRVLDAQTGEMIKEIRHDDGIDGLASSHDGRYMVSGQEIRDGKGPARVYSTADWSLVHTLDHGATVNEINFTSDDKYLVTAGHAFVKVWEPDSGNLVQTWEIEQFFQNHQFINVNIHPNNRWVAAGSNRGYIYIYDLESMKQVRRVNKLGQKIETIAWTGDGRHLATAGHSMTIDFFATEYLLDKSLDDHSIPFALRVPVSDHLEYMEFNDLGTLLTTAHQDGTIQLWTFMSDIPGINQRRHEEVKAIQTKAAAQLRD